MARIREINIFDKIKFKRAIEESLQNQSGSFYFRDIISFPMSMWHQLLPIKYKFLSETYIALDERNEICSLISLKPFKGNIRKCKITKLFLNKWSIVEARQIIDFVLARYGAKGVNCFIASIDENNTTLLELFDKECGFRSCGTQKIFKAGSSFEKLIHPYDLSGNLEVVDKSRQSIAQNIVNDSILPYFRISLSVGEKEFRKRQNKKNTVKQALIKNGKGLYIGYFSIIKMSENKYLSDISVLDAYRNIYENIVSYCFKLLKDRESGDFEFYILNKSYCWGSKEYEKFLCQKECMLIQTQCILVKDFYSRAEDHAKILKSVFFNDINSNFAYRNFL